MRKYLGMFYVPVTSLDLHVVSVMHKENSYSLSSRFAVLTILKSFYPQKFAFDYTVHTCFLQYIEYSIEIFASI